MTKFDMQRPDMARLWSAFSLTDRDDSLSDLSPMETIGAMAGLGTVVALVGGALVGYSAAKAYRRNGGSMSKAMMWGAGSTLFPIPAAIATYVIER